MNDLFPWADDIQNVPNFAAIDNSKATYPIDRPPTTDLPESLDSDVVTTGEVSQGASIDWRPHVTLICQGRRRSYK